MRRNLFVYLILILSLIGLTGPAAAAPNAIYGATALTGGATGALDSIQCDDAVNDYTMRALATGDIAVVVTSDGKQYFYRYNQEGVDSESSPTIIVPDDRADCSSAGQWNLVGQVATTIEATGAISTASTITATGAISSAAAITGLTARGADITGAVNHNTTDLHGKVYVFTAAATVTLDAAADAGYGAPACYRIRDAAEAAVIDVQAGEKINLRGTALAAGTAITATGAGEYVCLMATTDTDGSGTDGWETWGISSGWASE